MQVENYWIHWTLYDKIEILKNKHNYSGYNYVYYQFIAREYAIDLKYRLG